MTTPRFPYNFWWKHKPQNDVSLSGPVPPPMNRLEAFAAFSQDNGERASDEEPASEAETVCDADAPCQGESGDDAGDPLGANASWKVVSDWRPGVGTSSQSLFIPEHYEAKYPYPLLVWITDDGVPCDLASVMLDVSTRNFFGLAFPVPRASAEEAADEDRSAFLLDAMKDAVLTVRRRFHIHSERIYLAGFGAGAGWALQLVLQKPEWFGGAAVLGGRVGSMKEALAQFGNLQGKRVLLGVGGREGNGAVDELARTSQLLHSAGVNVETQLFDSGREATARLLNQVNRWVMDGICETV
jgi:phospholipase/carboxylesterase